MSAHDAAPLAVFFADPAEVFAQEAPESPTVIQHDPRQPGVSVFDFGFMRGDGVFEGVSVVDGVALAWPLHLRRLIRSAEIMELPAPNPAAFTAFVHGAIAAMPDGLEFAHLRLIITRGLDPAFSAVDKPAAPTVVAIIDPAFTPKANEVAIITMRHDLSASEPSSDWLLRGAKTLSYATNFAAKREIERRGAQNGVWVSRDGYLLEGPQSSIVIREGNRITTPDPAIGILHGTTQIELFAWAAMQGYDTVYGRIEQKRLRYADQVWMLGASGVQDVTSVDGDAIASDPAVTADIRRSFLEDRDVIDAWSSRHVAAFDAQTQEHEQS